MKILILILTSMFILSGCWWNDKKPEKVAIPGAEIISIANSGNISIIETGAIITTKTPYHNAP